MPPHAPLPKGAGAKPAKRGRSKITNGLVALSSAAILSVYAVGYTHTQSADAQDAGATPPAHAVVAAQGILPTAAATFAPTIPGGNGGYFLLASPTPTVTPAPAPALNTAPAIATVAPTAAVPTTTAAAAAATTPIAANTPVATSPRAPATAVSTVVPTRAVVAMLPPVLPVTVTPSAAVATPTPAPRATATPAPAPAAAAASTEKYRDGSYTGTGTSRRGDIEVLVVVQGGKIASAEITQCNTSYSCTRIAALPGQVVARQSADVNNISRATYSTQAYQGAVADALAQATA